MTLCQLRPGSVLLLSAFIASVVNAQIPAPFRSTPAELLAGAAKLKPEEGASIQILFDDSRLDFDAAGRSRYTWRRAYQILTEEDKDDWASISASWSPWHQERPAIRARVVTKDGREFPLDLKTLTESPAREYARDIFSDQRTVRAPLPGIAVGAIVEMEIDTVDRAPLSTAGVANRFSLGSGVPIGQTRFVVSAPSTIPLQVKTHNLPATATKREEAAGRVTFTIDHGPIAAMKLEHAMLPGDVRTRATLEVSSGESWAKVASHYASQVDAQIANPGLTELLKEIPANANREATIAAAMAILHREARYTGLEFGEAAMVPARPVEVIQRHYGDCKDKAALLAAMLRARKIPAYVALLSTGPGLDIEPDHPGLGMFDHAIVYVPGSPEYWIDATAQYAVLGSLPAADRDRWALVASESTKGLVRTPALLSAENRTVETREVFMAERGKARIVETTVSSPHGGIGLRADYASSDPKEFKKNLEQYAEDAYLRAKLDSFKTSAPGDLAVPLQLRLEMSNSGRGVSETASGVVGIRPMEMANSLPAYFRTEEKEGGEKLPARTADYVVLHPFVLEWRYRIVPANGFQARELPKESTDRFGTASLMRKYSLEEGGVVSAVFTFDSGKGRLSPAEGEELRKGILSFLKSDPVLIHFDQSGELLLSKGKAKEALAEFRKEAAKDPKNAIPHTRIALALLKAGLGEAARKEAFEATKIDPKLAYAWQTLGYVRQHDLVGRFRSPGYDLEGAIAAYRKAKELEPDGWLARVDLAILLEFDASGMRYSSLSKMAEAIAEYKEIPEEEKSGVRAGDNLLYALFHSGRYKELLERITTAKATANTRVVQVAATAMAEGASAALRAAENVPENERQNAIVTAGRLVAQRRNYQTAAELLTAAARSGGNGSQVLGLANALRNAKRMDQTAPPLTDPAGVPFRLMTILLGEEEPKSADFVALLAKTSRQGEHAPDLNALGKAFGVGRQQIRRQVAASGFPLQVIADIGMTSMQVSKEGDDKTGYRIRIVPPNTDAKGAVAMFVAREGDEYRLFGIDNSPDDIGAEATRRANAGDLAGARKILDWVRETSKRAGGDDPLAGPAFPHFWERGNEASLEQTLLAAAVLSDDRKDSLELLQQKRTTVQDGSEAIRLDHAIAHAAIRQGKMELLLAAAQRSKKTHPLSETRFGWEVNSLRQLKRYAEAEAVVTERLAKLPSDAIAMRAGMMNGLYKPDWKAMQEWMSKLTASGQANAIDFNNMAWAGLITNGATEEVDQWAHKAVAGDKKDFGSLHTIATVFADSGRVAEAKDLLLQAMNEADLIEPNGSCWLVLGWIAERLELPGIAKELYGRVIKEHPDADDRSFSNTGVARARMARLR
ncbi:MAG: DUF3857 domain-containing protein [Acidobacteria bacterium]|nr:DUF3857 domain-containing protein [Acidobacteriota bacterium]